MIVKYRINGEMSSIMQVVDVYNFDDTVFFTPLSDLTQPIKISPISNDRYNGILFDLYSNGHTDVSDLCNRTSYDLDDSDDLVDGEGGDQE